MNLAKLVAVLVAVVVAVFLLMPQEKLDGIKEGWLRAKSDPGQACLDFERLGLKDPDSARLLNASKGDGSKVTITYKAKNSYGAFGQAEVVCSVDGDGNVQEVSTRLARENIRLGEKLKLLDAKNECLAKRIALMLDNKNMSPAEANRLMDCDGANR